MKKSFSLLAVSLLPILSVIAETPAESTDDLNLAEMIQPISDDNILYHPDFYNWGSSIIKGKDGKYHLFYAQMKKRHSFYSWLTHGIISRAVADNPEGPYTHVETVLEGRGQPHWDAHTAHNPRVKFFDGKYYVYYMSTNPLGQEFDRLGMDLASRAYSNKGLSQEAKDAFWKESRRIREIFRRNQRIGVIVADDVAGPWTRFDEPMVEPAGPIVNITCNPAVTERPDGGYLMLVRGDKPNVKRLVRSQAIALADTPTGPWVVQDKAAVGDLNAEDPAVWYDHKRERYYGIYHAFGYMGLITSTDGKNWENAKHYKVLGKSIFKTDGSKVNAARLERPFIYVEDGEPKVMTVAIRERSGKTYSVFIPLK